MKRTWRALKSKPGVILILAALWAFSGGCSVVKPSRTIVQAVPDMAVGEGAESRGSQDKTPLEAPADIASEARTEASDAQGEAQPNGSKMPVVQVTPPTSDAGVTDTGKTSAAGKSLVEGESNPPGLIARSENAVTQTERDALYKALGFELDELIQLLDRLDNVQESDLNLDEFEE